VWIVNELLPVLGSNVKTETKCNCPRQNDLPSIEAVDTKSAVMSTEISLTDARWGLYDLMRLPLRSRI